MKKLMGIIFLYFAFSGCADALQVVYPKTNPAKINANSTFFIGSTPPGSWLKINGIDVKVATNGAFAQAINLNIGENNFILTSGADTLNFIINRAQPSASPKNESLLIEFPPINFSVHNDGAALRTNPKESGINRISHLPVGTVLIINAEKGNFYRVILSEDNFAWVSKSDVEQTQYPANKALLTEQNVKENDEFCLYEFELTEKVPYVLTEEDGLTLKIYNLENNPNFCVNIPRDRLIGYNASYVTESKFISVISFERVFKLFSFKKKTVQTIETQCNKLIVKVRKFPIVNSDCPLNNIKIVVDAGHGGSEKGAIGCCGDFEKDINFAIAKNLNNELKNRGAHVYMTREDDSKVSLQDRVKFARDKDASILLSIHANALPDGQDPIKNRGTSVYYYHKQAKPLADSILREMTTQLSTNNDRVRQGSLALVRPTASVSVLIEVAYMINPDDSALLLDKNFQIRCSKAIADGVEKYLIQTSGLAK